MGPVALTARGLGTLVLIDRMCSSRLSIVCHVVRWRRYRWWICEYGRRQCRCRYQDGVPRRDTVLCIKSTGVKSQRESPRHRNRIPLILCPYTPPSKVFPKCVALSCPGLPCLWMIVPHAKVVDEAALLRAVDLSCC